MAGWIGIFQRGITTDLGENAQRNKPGFLKE
jgi:hypothetical protein